MTRHPITIFCALSIAGCSGGVETTAPQQTDLSPRATASSDAHHARTGQSGGLGGRGTTPLEGSDTLVLTRISDCPIDAPANYCYNEGTGGVTTPSGTGGGGSGGGYSPSLYAVPNCLYGQDTFVWVQYATRYTNSTIWETGVRSIRFRSDCLPALAMIPGSEVNVWDPPIGLVSWEQYFEHWTDDGLSFLADLGAGAYNPDYEVVNPCAFVPSLCVRLATGAIASIAASPRGQAAIQRGSLLARNLANSQIVRQAEAAAHHIVAKGAKAAEPARQRLIEFGIAIDDAINGVFLPATRTSTQPGMYHPSLQTQAYYARINEAILAADSREEAVLILEPIRAALISGTLFVAP